MVLPAPFHCMVRVGPAFVQVAVTSRTISDPVGGTKTTLLRHVPSAWMMNVPERTSSAAPSWETLVGTLPPFTETRV